MKNFPISGWRQWLPCSITLLALLAGFHSIMLALMGIEVQNPRHLGLSSFFILLAWIFDSLDGAVARKVKGMSAFGAELDTFTDFLAFSVAPSILVYAVTLNDFPGIIRTFVPSIMVISGAVRLSRFRVADADRGLNGYTGLPVTLVAALITFWIMLLIPDDSMELNFPAQVVLLFSVLLAAFLQVSGVQYPAPTKKPKYLITGLALLLIFLTLWVTGSPYKTIFGIIMIAIGYVYSVIVPLITRPGLKSRGDQSG